MNILWVIKFYLSKKKEKRVSYNFKKLKFLFKDIYKIR